MPDVLADAGELDLTALARPGDLVVWSQACAEPRSLTEQLMRRRLEIGHFWCFLGIPTSNMVRSEHADQVSFLSYCGSDGNRALYREGMLDIVPVHYSSLPGVLSRGPLQADVLLLQVAPSDEHARYSLGLADDYVSAVAATARVVVAEVNDQVPRTRGSCELTDDDFDVVVRSSRVPAESITKPAGAITEQIAANVSELIEDGVTLQFGVGALPEAVLRGLADRKDLGVHSGLINDAAMDLMEAGVVTHACKSVDRGHAVAGFLMSSGRLFRFGHDHPAICLREARYTHDPDVLAAQERLVVINSAIEVALSGQVNAEVAGGEYVGPLGGGRGLPPRGRALSRRRARRRLARHRGGSQSDRRDALRAGEHTTVRCRCRGYRVRQRGPARPTVAVRRERMLAIAHPDHRHALEDAIDDMGVTA